MITYSLARLVEATVRPFPERIHEPAKLHLHVHSNTQQYTTSSR